MVISRGDIWWASLPEASGSAPAYRRPVLVIQADSFNISNIHTIIALAITSNLNLANAPGNIFISTNQSGLPRDSVVNVSQIITLNKTMLTQFVKTLSPTTMQRTEDGLRLVLSL